MDDNWTKITEALSGTGDHARGIYATCPFCSAESTRGKAVFLIIFEGGVFRHYSCFKCGERGSGDYGTRYLARHLGVSINAFSREHRKKTETTAPSPIIWPPPWVVEDDETIEAGLEYLEQRGVDLDAVGYYDLRFTSSLDIGGDDSYIIRYPSILAPHTDSDGNVYGWSAREIPSIKAPGCQRPKSYMASGQKWKEVSAFGLDKVSPEAPISIVEGFFDTLSTPNAVSFGGKGINERHLANIARLHPTSIILALDADVQDEEPTTIEKLKYKLSMQTGAETKIYALDWDKVRDILPGASDPGTVGRKQMTAFIKEIKKWCL